MLEKHTNMLEKHKNMLQKHTNMLEKHTNMYPQITQRIYRPKYPLECTGTRILQLNFVNTIQAKKESDHHVVQTYQRFTKLSSYFWGLQMCDFW